MEGVEERENINEEEGHNEDQFDTENKDGDSCRIVEDGDNSEHATDITNHGMQDETFFNDDELVASDIKCEHKHWKYELKIKF